MSLFDNKTDQAQNEQDLNDGNGWHHEEGQGGDERRPLGMVVAGSLTEGMEVRLNVWRKSSCGRVVCLCRKRLKLRLLTSRNCVALKCQFLTHVAKDP